MILSDKEISKYLDVSDPAHIRLATTKILEQQDIQTRQDTLREVGEWLGKNQIGSMVDGDGCLHFSIDGYDFEALKRGEMPEQSGT